jgi:hypothetical protein
MNMMQTIIHSNFMKGAIPGLLVAFNVDYQVFKTWKSFHDATTYNWGIALWRWLQGFVIGGLGATGYGVIA